MSKLIVTANGIDTGRFENLNEERQRHRFIWSSSPDRGLDRVLQMWPAIRKMWPDAELHIYYGFQYMTIVYQRSHPKRREMVEGLMAQMAQPGVVYHGRINQEELAREFARSQFWFYPTSFTETYCISAIEAQAAGCTPVTSSVAALEDKVPARFRLRNEAGDEKYLQLLRAIDEGRVEGLTEEERATALARTWDAVFEQWEKLIDVTFEKRKKEREEREKVAAKKALAARKKNGS